MAKTKAKKTPKAPARKPDPEVWAQPKFKALLDGKGKLSSDGLKIMIENQRGINGKLYDALEDAIKAIQKANPEHGKKGSPLDKALALVKTVPGDGPPGCPGGN